MVATVLLKLAMEMDEERKARLKKMVATIPDISCSILRGVIINKVD